MDAILYSSARLDFRKLTCEDFESIYMILSDPEIMYAWEHGFSKEESQEWLQKNLMRYEKDGFSYFAMIEKASGHFIGVMGPLIETIADENYIGLGYILHKKYWGYGFASEGARASLDYAFRQLNAEKVIAEIRPENVASCRVAESMGMSIVDQFEKKYRGKTMLHFIYSIDTPLKSMN